MTKIDEQCEEGRIKDRGANIKRQIMFSHCEEVIQDVSSDMIFISASECLSSAVRLISRSFKVLLLKPLSQI